MTALQRAWRGGRSDWRIHVLSIFSIAIAFVCLATALLVVVNVDSVRERWTQSGRASVYLNASAPEESVQKLETALRATPGVGGVRRVTPAQARDELLQQGDPDGVLARLPDRAFPASLELELEGSVTKDRLQAIVARLGALPTVESVETYADWTARLGSVLRGGFLAAGLLALVVLAAVASVVASAIRLTLQRRSREVQVLKLVGATDGYVRQPFVLEGAAQGALGALLALVLLGVLYGLVVGRMDGQLETLFGVAPRFLPWTIMLLLMASGAALGALAAHASLRRHLKA